jgi:hypothetical protein
MIRGQARFLGKSLRAPAPQITAAILLKGGERDDFSPANAWKAGIDGQD